MTPRLTVDRQWLTVGFLVLALSGVGAVAAQPVETADRSLPASAAPNETVTVTVETTFNDSVSESLRITETFDPAVRDVELQSATLDGDIALPNDQSATDTELTATYDEPAIEAGQTLAVTYAFTVPDETTVDTQINVSGTISADDTDMATGTSTLVLGGSGPPWAVIGFGLLGAGILLAIGWIVYSRRSQSGGTMQNPFE